MVMYTKTKQTLQTLICPSPAAVALTLLTANMFKHGKPFLPSSKQQRRSHTPEIIDTTLLMFNKLRLAQRPRQAIAMVDPIWEDNAET